MNNKKGIYILFFALCMSLLSACGQYDPYETGGEGSIAFDVKWEDTQADLGQALKSGALLMTVSDCLDISTVEAKVYDSTNISLATGGPWQCSAHSGSITGVPAGSNRKAVILGKDSSGNIRYRGEQTGVTVVAGLTSNLGTIIASSFVPTGITAAAGNATATISWTSVTGAASYNIYWSTTTGVKKTTGTKITGPGVTSPYAHTGRTNGTTYFYRGNIPYNQRCRCNICYR